jgi:hypothetical protein
VATRLAARPRGQRFLKSDKAADLMRQGSRLVQMHNGPEKGISWFVVPGGEINADTAAAIIRRPDVEARYDALFPGMSQTWRMGGATP